MNNQTNKDSGKDKKQKKQQVQEDCFEEFMVFKDTDLDSQFKENPTRIKYWKEEWSDEEQKLDSLQRIKKALV